jgi:hypothetical protein
VKAKILPRPPSGVHESFSLPHSTQAGRGHQIQERQSAQRCMTNLPFTAASQKGRVIGVISGSGFGNSLPVSAMF